LTASAIGIDGSPRRGAVYQLDYVMTPLGLGESTACPIANNANSAAHCTTEAPYPLVLAYAP